MGKSSDCQQFDVLNVKFMYQNIDERVIKIIREFELNGQVVDDLHGLRHDETDLQYEIDPQYEIDRQYEVVLLLSSETVLETIYVKISVEK